MKPNWQKLASLVWPTKYAHSGFSSLVQSLLPKDTLLRTYLMLITINKEPKLSCQRIMIS